jgi:uncharacterized membrane protein HdeD (DUF308 family)
MLVDRWWAFVLRGVVALILGVAAIVVPAAVFKGLAFVFATYAIADGATGLVGAMRGIKDDWRALAQLLGALVSIAAGAVTIAAPRLTAGVLLYIIAIWAIGTGLLEIVAAVRLRKVVAREWLFAAAGVMSVGFGVLLLLRPRIGALVIVYQIGAFSLMFGATLIGLGLRLYTLRPRGSSRRVATGSAI